MSHRNERKIPATAAAALLALLVGITLAVALGNGRTVHAGEMRPAVEVASYASPLEVLLSPDGARLYVLCQGTEDIRVLDTANFVVIKKIPVGAVPRGFSFSPDGARLYVTNSAEDTLSVIDTAKLEVVATWKTGPEPSSVIEEPSGKRLFVANRISNDVSVLDATTGVEEKRLSAGRGASYLALAPDGSKVYVTHVYPNPSAYRTAPESEITVIDAARAVVIDRIPLHGIAHAFHVEFSPMGA